MLKKIVYALLLAHLVFLIGGCVGTSTENSDGNNVLSGDAPPSVGIEIDGENYDTKLGTYCWGPGSDGKAECVDVAGPLSLLEDEEPIQVEAGEQITFIMDYTPKPNKIHLSQIQNDNETEIEVNDDQFSAPDKEGVYYFDYGVWWMDDEDVNLSHGDAFYAFVIEVN